MRVLVQTNLSLKLYQCAWVSNNCLLAVMYFCFLVLYNGLLSYSGVHWFQTRAQQPRSDYPVNEIHIHLIYSISNVQSSRHDVPACSVEHWWCCAERCHVSVCCIVVLLLLVQGAAAGSDSRELQRRVVDSGASCSLSYKDLLEHINVVSEWAQGSVCFNVALCIM